MLWTSKQLSTYRLGVAAENLVAQRFESLGFIVVAKRYKTKYGEIDLVAHKENQIIFAEVKARSKIVSIDSIITQRQINRNYTAAEFFLSNFPAYKDHACRFDLILVVGGKILHHIQEIFP